MTWWCRSDDEVDPKAISPTKCLFSIVTFYLLYEELLGRRGGSYISYPILSNQNHLNLVNDHHYQFDHHDHPWRWYEPGVYKYMVSFIIIIINHSDNRHSTIIIIIVAMVMILTGVYEYTVNISPHQRLASFNLGVSVTEQRNFTRLEVVFNDDHNYDYDNPVACTGRLECLWMMITIMITTIQLHVHCTPRVSEKFSLPGARFEEAHGARYCRL